MQNTVTDRVNRLKIPVAYFGQQKAAREVKKYYLVFGPVFVLCCCQFFLLISVLQI